jgi:subtilase family serine protease
VGIRRNVLAIGAVLALAGSAIPASAASDRATLTGNVPPWAQAATFKGAANDSDNVGFRVYLKWENASQAQAMAEAVSDPANALYGHYLTPQQFRQQFAPAQSQVSAIQAWLRGQGFSVEYTPLNNHYVSAEGTAAQVAAAFGTSFGMYAVGGLTLRSPSSDISVPAALAPMVSGVIGLDDGAQLVHTNVAAEPDATPSPAFVSGRPCSSFWAEKTTDDLPTSITADPLGYSLPLPLAPCGYMPAQIRGAYGVTGTGDGSGQAVAIIDAYASPTIQQDLDKWSANRQMASTRIVQVVAPGTFNHPEKGLKQDPQGWYGEETLDVESVHGMAPGATIVYVGAPNNFQDLDAALNHVVDRHLASIVSNSYGFIGEDLPPGFIKPYLDTMIQGAAEGIGIYFSSGDSGDDSTFFGGQTAVDWPASSPFVTAVGGTSLAVGGNNDYLFETGWGTRNRTWHASTASWGGAFWLYGGGGGVSRIFGVPSYQKALQSNGALAGIFDAQGRTGRVVPDIAAFGDPNTGYMIGQTQTFPDGSVQYSEYRIGGTSLSSPIMAGIMAVVDQARARNGRASVGFANPLLYSKAGSAAFNDIVDPAIPLAVVRVNYVNGIDASAGLSFRLRTLNDTLSLHTTSGYDDVTGLGTPTGSFVGALSG